ncbi:hypothetical protein E3T55_14195 [Cryobacterium frigoriphilum]|uniref:Uncharacterized protein n=1 Tax=Cryobacterium frigoriphilum TaxID=1259150 RepID=A0A4R8ZVX4_9MICO|nr:hypothetical protein [Cryobacterium frigoriphilum]TFD47713.1 hypothetical protein E3T55_14195 [Cryobacterium frigoriphilum]
MTGERTHLSTAHALLPGAELPPALAAHTIWCDDVVPGSPARLVFAVHINGRRAQLAALVLAATMLGLGLGFPDFFIAGVTVGCAAAITALSLTDRFGTGFYAVDEAGALGPRIVHPAPDRTGLSRRRLRWF